MVPWYIHIQSSNHESGNDFKVKVPHGLNACTRVASQNFSIPNSIGNTYGPFSKLIGLSYPFPVEIMGRGHSNDVCVCVCVVLARASSCGEMAIVLSLCLFVLSMKTLKTIFKYY